MGFGNKYRHFLLDFEASAHVPHQVTRPTRERTSLRLLPLSTVSIRLDSTRPPPLRRKSYSKVSPGLAYTSTELGGLQRDPFGVTDAALALPGEFSAASPTAPKQLHASESCSRLLAGYHPRTSSS